MVEAGSGGELPERLPELPDSGFHEPSLPARPTDGAEYVTSRATLTTSSCPPAVATTPSIWRSVTI